MNALEDIQIEEISLLSSGVRPAVRAAQIAVVKHTAPAQKGTNMEFPELVETIRARDNCARTQAMEKAERQHPEAFEKYQSAGLVPVSQIRKAAPPPTAVTKFMALVDEHRLKFGTTRVAALEAVRKASPDEFGRFQEC